MKAAKFENRQWKVTNYGIENVRGAPEYFFSADRLLEMEDRGPGMLYDWPLHMAEKVWVDIDAFCEAFVHALKIHRRRYKGKVDLVILEKSLRKAKESALYTLAEEARLSPPGRHNLVKKLRHWRDM